jgi:hypothetical protein
MSEIGNLSRTFGNFFASQNIYLKYLKKVSYFIAKMTTPLTRKEMDEMADNVLLEFIMNGSPRLYPQCLVGQKIDEARKQFKEWTKAKVEILIADRDGCSMDYNTCYFYCYVNGDDIITKIWKAFE